MKQILIFITVLSISVSSQAREVFPTYNPVHDDNFNPLPKIDYHLDYFESKIVEYTFKEKNRGVETRLIVYPDCYYVAKFSRKVEDTVTQYCGAKLEGVENKRYKNSGVDENSYWDKRKMDENPDNEFTYRFNFNLEKGGDITFNLLRSLNAVPFLFSCEQKFNPNDDGVAPNPSPICTFEAAGRKGRKLEEMFDQFSPKKYWTKIEKESVE